MRSLGTGPHKSPRGVALVPLDMARRNHEFSQSVEKGRARLQVLAVGGEGLIAL